MISYRPKSSRLTIHNVIKKLARIIHLEEYVEGDLQQILDNVSDGSLPHETVKD